MESTQRKSHERTIIAAFKLFARSGTAGLIQMVSRYSLHGGTITMAGDVLAPPAIGAQPAYSASAAVPQNARLPKSSVAAPHRRRIPPVSGHALEKLGHAIEYLTDEYVHDGCFGGLQSPRVEAIQLLVAANRSVYFDCPVIPSIRDRIRDLLSLPQVKSM